MTNVVIAAFYQFVPLPNYKELKPTLEALCLEEGICGTILLAHEGINSTVAGTRRGIDRLKASLLALGPFDRLEYKESFCDKIPFVRLKVRLKKEIVTIGDATVSPIKKVGTYVDPDAWNQLLADPDVIVVDTRNDYEVQIGTFKGAIDPKTRTFRQFPDYVRLNLQDQKHKKIALFCTGGIRCEKASSFMLAEGFEDVYHLKGGILKYLETMPQDQSQWQGDCFVFDQRVGVTEGVHVGAHDMCYGCRFPISQQDKLSVYYEEGVTCPQCYKTKSETSKNRARSRQQQHLRQKNRADNHPKT